MERLGKGHTGRVWAFHSRDTHTCRQRGRSHRRYPVHLVSIAKDILLKGVAISKKLKTYVDQEELRARLAQRAVSKEGEFRRFLLECLLVVAEAELVRQGTAETAVAHRASAPCTSPHQQDRSG